MRRMMLYGKKYGGADPQLIEGDVFRMIISVPEFGEIPAQKLDIIRSKAESKVESKVESYEEKLLIFFKTRSSVKICYGNQAQIQNCYRRSQPFRENNAKSRVD